MNNTSTSRMCCARTGKKPSSKGHHDCKFLGSVELLKEGIGETASFFDVKAFNGSVDRVCF